MKLVLAVVVGCAAVWFLAQIAVLWAQCDAAKDRKEPSNG